MRDRALITTGIVGAVVAAFCCATPLGHAVRSHTAWLAKADYVLIPTLILCVALIVFGLYRPDEAWTPMTLKAIWTGTVAQVVSCRLTKTS
jgi:mercuric ion transport protein